MRYGCENCKHCKCYPGDYWTPDDFECMGEPTQEAIDRAWTNGETWKSSEEQICPSYEEAVYDEPDYDEYLKGEEE